MSKCRGFMISIALLSFFFIGRPASILKAETTDTSAASKPVDRFVILPVKPERRDSYLHAVLDNIRHSRQEPGNLSFLLFQEEKAGDTLFLFERWADAAVIATHRKQPNYLAVQSLVATDLSQPPFGVDFTTLPEIPESPAKPAVHPETARTIIVLLSVKPEEREHFIAAYAKSIPLSRADAGNLSFNLYQDPSDATRFLIVEHWESAAAHEAHLAQPHVRAIEQVLANALARPATESRYFLKEISLN